MLWPKNISNKAILFVSSDFLENFYFSSGTTEYFELKISSKLFFVCC